MDRMLKPHERWGLGILGFAVAVTVSINLWIISVFGHNASSSPDGATIPQITLMAIAGAGNFVILFLSIIAIARAIRWWES